MGERVSFASNGDTCEGYLAMPAAGRGPGVVVIQEWWGLVGHITAVADRFADAGFLALAPDLYHGKVAREPDEAGKLLMGMAMDQAARDIAGCACPRRPRRGDRSHRHGGVLHGRLARAVVGLPGQGRGDPH